MGFLDVKPARVPLLCKTRSWFAYLSPGERAAGRRRVVTTTTVADDDGGDDGVDEGEEDPDEDEEVRRDRHEGVQREHEPRHLPHAVDGRRQGAAGWSVEGAVQRQAERVEAGG